MQDVAEAWAMPWEAACRQRGPLDELRPGALLALPSAIARA
jgi:hypothetical protein